MSGTTLSHVYENPLAIIPFRIRAPHSRRLDTLMQLVP
jgi:hypothetical protein